MELGLIGSILGETMTRSSRCGIKGRRTAHLHCHVPDSRVKDEKQRAGKIAHKKEMFRHRAMTHLDKSFDTENTRVMRYLP